MSPGGGGGGSGGPYESDGDARRLAWGCKLQILASLRVFGMESYHICPFMYSCWASFSLASPQTSFGVRLSHIHFSPTEK